MQPTKVGLRSRSGCTTCRRRHRKCDEQRPACRACQSQDLRCVYESKIKWNKVSNIASFGISSRRKSNSSSRTTEQVSKASRSSCQSNGQSHRPRAAHTSSHDTALVQYTARESDSLAGEETQSSLHLTPSFLDEARGLESQSRHLPPHYWHLGSDQIGVEEINNGPPSNPDLLDNESENELQSLDRVDEASEVSENRNPAHDPLSPCVIDNTLTNLLFQIFQTSGEEGAFSYFFKRVCTCMPAYDGRQNPYRKLALVALSYPVLLQGILSVSTAHMYNFGQSNDRLLSSRQSRALKSLRLALNDLQESDDQNEVTESRLQSPSTGNGVFSILSNREIALAAIMMQTSSVLMTGIGDAEVHMRCALHFVQKLDYLHRPAKSIFAKLLVNRFGMVDVVLAHLRFQRPMAPLDFFLYQQNEKLDHEEPSFREVHGCPQPVLCFLARIAILSADLAESDRPQSQIQGDGYILETEMRAWAHQKYDTMTTMSTGPESRLFNTRKNEHTDLDIVCECYYWTSLLLLMRRVFVDSTETSRVQIIRRHLFRLMDKLVPGCGPDSSLPFPFYMAAREAVTPEDREWVRQKHVAMMEVYRDRSREYLMMSTEIIWNNATRLRGSGDDDMYMRQTSHDSFIRNVDRQASYFMF